MASGNSIKCSCGDSENQATVNVKVQAIILWFSTLTRWCRGNNRGSWGAETGCSPGHSQNIRGFCHLRFSFRVMLAPAPCSC